MKKRERVVVQLCNEYDQQYAYVKTNGKKTTIKHLLSFLDECREKREITNGKKIRREKTTDYVYSIKTKEDILEDIESEKYSFIIKVKNSEKSMFYETIKYMESLCDLSATLKKINTARIAAGILAGSIALSYIGPRYVTFVKEHNESWKKYEQQMLDELEIINHELTEEEKEEGMKQYYETLRQKAEAGDKAAQEEYERYLFEQQISEQLDQNKKTR